MLFLLVTVCYDKGKGGVLVSQKSILVIVLLATMLFAFPVDALAVSGIDSYPSHYKEINNYRQFYAALSQALQNFDRQIVLKINNYDGEKYNVRKTIEKILADNPDLDYGYTGGYTYILGQGKKRIIKQWQRSLGRVYC